MADIKPKAEEDKEGDTSSDRPWHRLSSLSSSAQSRATTGLCSDSEHRPINGPQPEPVSPSGGNSSRLPSHSIREGTPQQQDESDGSSNSSGPNTVENVASRVTQKFLLRSQLDNISSAKETGESPFAKNKSSPRIKSEEASASDVASDSDNSDFQVPHPDEPSKCSLIESAGQNRAGTGVTDGRSLWDFGSESSESSSDDCEEDSTWEPQSEFMHLLWTSPKRSESSSSSISQSRRKRKLNSVDRAEGGGFAPLAKQPPTYDCSDDNDSLVSKEHNGRRKPVANFPVAPQLDCSDEAVDSKEHFIKSKCLEGNDAKSAKLNHESAKQNHTSTESDSVSDPDGEPLFFPCTKCNVNFKEKAHLHRHMLQHQAPPNASAPRPYICRECGRSFRDGNALQKHMVIHQARRERLMEEIKGLSELQDEGRQARLQCPQCVFGTDCAKTFVQHAKTHEKDKRYYCCDSCNHMATTPQELEQHRCTAHNVNHVHMGSTHRKRAEGREDTETGTNRITLLYCTICPFSTQNRNILKKHTELIHRQPYFERNDKKEVGKEEKEKGKPVSRFAEPKKPGLDLCRLTSQAKPGHSRLSQLRPKLISETQALGKEDMSPFWSDGIADLCVRNRVAQQKGQKGLSLPLFKWGFGSSTNKLSSALPRLDKPSKLSPSLTARIDVTTGHLPDEEGNQECAALRPGDGEKTKHISDSDVRFSAKTENSVEDIRQNHKTVHKSNNNVILSGKELPSQPLPHRTVSKRKMSIPYHNTLKPKPEPISPVLTEEDDDDDDDDDDDEEEEEEEEEEYDNDDDEGDSYDLGDYSTTFLNRSTAEGKLNSFVSPKPLFLPRPRLPVRKDILHSTGSEDEEESDCDDIQDLVIKEECEETAVNLDDVPSTQSMHGPFPELQGPQSFSSDRKTCPYCPAVFESGVGLSNHVRGHLHRVGLTYDARHMVSPEQVASRDRQPRIRRKAPSTISRRLKKAVDKPESQTEHTCPLCWGWFDTRTGLSNHVRGHLKRIGRGLGSGIPGSSRSPLCILNDLLRDETEHRSLLALLGRRPSHSRPFVSQKFADSDGLFLTPTGVPVKVQHSRARVGAATTGGRATGSGNEGEPKSQLWSGQEAVECRKKEKEEEEEEIHVEEHSTLVELLRRRKQERDQIMRDRQQAQGARRQLPISLARENVGRLAALKPDPGWSQGKTDAKKVCIHCNTTFHSAVSLSNHLRAYARRKRAAQLEGTTYDCKQKKPRSRPGPKKKLFSLPHMPEEIYRLTCRFCDLVFQGPLSVQEDWIKHLQRHLMHTSVPHTGAAMVEVTAVCKELPPPPPPERLVLPRQHTPLQVPPTVS